MPPSILPFPFLNKWDSGKTFLLEQSMMVVLNRTPLPSTSSLVEGLIWSSSGVMVTGGNLVCTTGSNLSVRSVFINVLFPTESSPVTVMLMSIVVDGELQMNGFDFALFLWDRNLVIGRSDCTRSRKGSSA